MAFVPHLWSKPKKLLYPVKVVDATSEYYNKEGHVFANRPGETKVMVYFPVTKTLGNCRQFEFEQLERL